MEVCQGQPLAQQLFRPMEELNLVAQVGQVVLLLAAMLISLEAMVGQVAAGLLDTQEMAAMLDLRGLVVLAVEAITVMDLAAVVSDFLGKAPVEPLDRL